MECIDCFTYHVYQGAQLRQLRVLKHELVNYVESNFLLFSVAYFNIAVAWRMFTPRLTTDVALQKECKSCSQNANQKQNRQKLKQLENIKGITNKQYLHLLLWICTCTKSQIRKTKQRSNFLFLVSSMT